MDRDEICYLMRIFFFFCLSDDHVPNLMRFALLHSSFCSMIHSALLLGMGMHDHLSLLLAAGSSCIGSPLGARMEWDLGCSRMLRSCSILPLGHNVHTVQ